MTIGLGFFEILILAVGGLLCIGLPIGVIAALMAGNRNRERED